MTSMIEYILDHQLNAMRIAGAKVGAERSGERTSRSPTPTPAQPSAPCPRPRWRRCAPFATAHAYKPTLTRFERAAILNRPPPSASRGWTRWPR
jgi:hypothetical protein